MSIDINGWEVIGSYRADDCVVNVIKVVENKDNTAVLLVEGINGDGSDEYVFNCSSEEFLKRMEGSGFYKVDYNAHCIHECFDGLNEYESSLGSDQCVFDNMFDGIDWNFYEGEFEE